MSVQWVIDMHGRQHLTLAVGPLPAWEIVATICWRAIAIGPADRMGPPYPCPDCIAWHDKHRRHLRTAETVEQALDRVEVEDEQQRREPEEQLAHSSTC